MCFLDLPKGMRPRLDVVRSETWLESAVRWYLAWIQLERKSSCLEETPEIEIAERRTRGRFAVDLVDQNESYVQALEDTEVAWTIQDAPLDAYAARMSDFELVE